MTIQSDGKVAKFLGGVDSMNKSNSFSRFKLNEERGSLGEIDIKQDTDTQMGDDKKT